MVHTALKTVETFEDISPLRTEHDHELHVPCMQLWQGIKSESSCSLKALVKEHQNVQIQGQIRKSVITDHVWIEKGGHQSLWKETKITEKH